MDATQNDPPVTVAQSKNPFLNMAEETAVQEDARDENMLVDPVDRVTTSTETNPFRRSIEMQAMRKEEKEDQEMGS